jgi:phospholipid N-methyltransferase
MMPGSVPQPSDRSSSVAMSEFLRHPGMVGSAFPASTRLVRRMLEPLDWSRLDVLVEYGPGTGRFTMHALKKMKRGATLIAIETGEQFVDHLRASINDDRLRVVHGSAGDVMQVLADHGIDHADCILSGLPFSTLPPREAKQIIRASAAALDARGTFAAYQMRRAIEPLLRQSFSVVRSRFEWWNIPPCHLYWARSVKRHTLATLKRARDRNPTRKRSSSTSS